MYFSDPYKWQETMLMECTIDLCLNFKNPFLNIYFCYIISIYLSQNQLTISAGAFSQIVREIHVAA
jgi:hypothetical protein